MISLAYQATEEDAANILFDNNTTASKPLDRPTECIAGEVFALLDADLIQKAAMYGDDLDTQTTYANEEITRQLKTLKII